MLVRDRQLTKLQFITIPNVFRTYLSAAVREKQFKIPRR